MYEQNVIKVKQEQIVLCFSYKWLGEKEIHFVYGNGKDDDKVMKKLWKLFDEADATVAHNNRRFDRRKSNSRFAVLGLGPPSPYIIIDTLLIARKHFGFRSNKLGDLCEMLGFGGKHKHYGIELWFDFMGENGRGGRKRALKEMKLYNDIDVKLLERLYLFFRPWESVQINMGLYDREANVCPYCASTRLRKKGVRQTLSGQKQKWWCNDCKANSESRIAVLKPKHLRVDIK